MEIKYRTIGEVIMALGLIIFGGMALSEDKARFCDATDLVMNCDKVSLYYGLDNGKCWNAEYGNKLCRSGWNPISDLLGAEPITIGATFKVEANGGIFSCNLPEDKFITSYTQCKKDDGKEGYLGELV